jgi:TfoX/Sxy family transcriptional regulator of competence genes
MGFKRQWRKSPPELIDVFQSVIPSGPGIEHRKMFGYPCAFVNGNMFTGLHQEHMIIRLADSDRQEISDLHGASPFKPFGPDSKMTMREYVAVSASMLANPELLGAWVMKSVDYASSLPPKTKL